MNRDTVMFRFVPTMRCNFRCEYCFVSNETKAGGKTMFDEHTPAEWAEAMGRFADYDVEMYLWGGEPFCIDGTYEFLRECMKYEHVLPGIRVDTNVFYAEKIARLCPGDKLKLNCSYHMQYHTLEQEFQKVRLLKELDMVGMVNFVASRYNLDHLHKEYKMTVQDLVEKFAEIGVFLNVAGDFAFANHREYPRYEEYKRFILQFQDAQDWEWMRDAYPQERLCTAGMRMFTVQHDGSFTSCISNRGYGNFLQGKLTPEQEPGKCGKNCPSLVAYPFRCDNEFPPVNSLMAYVKRNEEYRRRSPRPQWDFAFGEED